MDRAEHIIEQFSASRYKWQAVGAAVVVLVILGIGLNTILAGFLGGHASGKSAAKKPAGITKSSSANSIGGAGSEGISAIGKAPFDYLLPGFVSGWTMDDDSKGYVADKGVVKFNLSSNGVNTVITEQMLPAALAPRQSAAFSGFVAGNKVSRSQSVGSGTLYFLPAILNGAIGNGADTVIYATDELLMFGKSDSMLSYDKWVNLFTAMKKP